MVLARSDFQPGAAVQNPKHGENVDESGSASTNKRKSARSGSNTRRTANGIRRRRNPRPRRPRPGVARVSRNEVDDNKPAATATTETRTSDEPKSSAKPGLKLRPQRTTPKVEEEVEVKPSAPRLMAALPEDTGIESLLDGLSDSPLNAPEPDDENAEVVEIPAELAREIVEPKRAVPEPESLLVDVKDALHEAKNHSAQADYTLARLGEEIRAIGMSQNRYERKYVLNSVFAYVIFCVLIFAGLYVIFDLRWERNEADRDFYDTELDRMAHELQIAEAELKKYRQGSQQAFEVYQLIEQARHQEALQKYIEVQDQLINPAEAALIQSRIAALKWKLAEQSYREGLELVQTSAFEQARDKFLESLEYQSETPYQHLLAYHLGISLYELGDYEGSRHHLGEAQKHELASDLAPEAQYFFAVSTERIGNSDEAYTLYERFQKRYRYHKHADDVRRRISKIDNRRNRDRAAAQRAAREQRLAEQEEKAKDDAGGEPDTTP